MGRKPVDVSGQNFGLLTPWLRVRGVDHPRYPKSVLWWCICECGGGRLATVSGLRGGGVRSCGCISRGVNGGRPKTTDQDWRHPLHNTYHQMIQRCTNPNSPSYQYYGGIGVKVCAKWMDSFEAFLEDVGERPPNPRDCTHTGPHFTLDRIDPFGDYEPGNVRWAIWDEQSSNKRTP